MTSIIIIICFLLFFFSSYLFWSSLSIINRDLSVFNFLFPCLIASFALAEVGTEYSSLYVLMNFVSANFVCNFSYCLTTFNKSSLFFFSWLFLFYNVFKWTHTSNHRILLTTLIVYLWGLFKWTQCICWVVKTFHLFLRLLNLPLRYYATFNF